MKDKILSQNRNFINKILYPCILVFLYSFIFSSTFSYINVLSSNILQTDSQLWLYRLNLLPFATGLLIYGLSESLRPHDRRTQAKVAGIFTLIALPLTVLLFYTSDPVLFTITAMIQPFFIGILGGFVHLEFLRLFTSGPRFGLLYAIGTSLSILVQFFFQNIIDSQALQAYSILMALFLLSAILLSPLLPKPDCPADGSNENASVKRDPESLNAPFIKKNFRMLLLSTVAIAILFELIGNFLTSSLLLMVADNDYLTYSWPRLFIIFAYLVAGIIADHKKTLYLPTFTLCVVFITILNPILFHSGEGALLNTCIFYLMAGAVNTYLTLRFLFLARMNIRFAPLISSSGRLLDSIFTCLLASPLLYSLSLEAIIFIEMIAIIIVILILSFTGQLNFSDPPQVRTISASRITTEEFARRYGFTEKETEIFQAMLSFSGTVSDLAKTLYLSRSILYRYQHNICEKTGCDNFADVRKLYYETPDSSEDFPEEVTDEISDTITDAKADTIPDATMMDATMDQKSDAITAKTKTGETGMNLSGFCETYHLSEGEAKTLALFLQNPGLSQSQLAEMRGVTLRTMQRHLGSIRQKTSVSSLPELTSLYLNFR